MKNPMDYSKEFFVFNGKLLPINQFDSNLLTGETTIYEVIRVVNSSALFLSDHLRRMQNSINIANLPQVDLETIENSIRELLQQSPIHEKNLRIAITYQLNKHLQNTVIYFIPSKYPTDKEKILGVWVKTIDAERSNPTAKVENKTLRNYADEVIQHTGCYEVLLVNAKNNITEGSRSNVFFVHRNKVVTAPTESVLSGVTREKVLQICAKLNINIVEKCLPQKDLNSIDGAFITGTSPGVLPINKINNITLNPNISIITDIIKEYNSMVIREIEQWK